MSAPQVTLHAFANGPCVRCRKTAERSKYFTAATYDQALRLCKDWEANPIHKRCEGL